MKQVDFQFVKHSEFRKRDAALDLFESYRGELLEAAKAIAEEIVSRNGRVTAPEVLGAMRDRGLGEDLDKVDRRFMGAVFRSGTGWKRLGWEPLGSHGRPVSIWTREKQKGVG